MKQILIIILGLFGIAYGQSSPTSAKTRFVNGIYLGTKLDSYFNTADSNAVYWRADSSLMAKYKGTARALAFAVSGGYLPISDTAAMLNGYAKNINPFINGNITLTGSVTNPVTILRTLISGDSARIQFLTQTNGTVPTNLVIYFHGDGETQNECFTDATERKITDYLIANGFYVASAYAGGSLWGNQAAQDAYYNLYAYMAANFTINKVIFIGQSMGGITSLNLVKSGRVPVNAWYGINPATNLRAAYFNEGFVSRIETAYGFSGGANYAAATAGFDPNTASYSVFNGVRYRMTASYSDAVILRSLNADSINLKFNSSPLVLESNIVTSLGAHGDTTHFIKMDVLDFSTRNYIHQPTNKAYFLGTVQGNGVPTNTINTVSNNNDFIGGQSYWAFRTDSLHGFNLDMYALGAGINAINGNQDGSVTMKKVTARDSMQAPLYLQGLDTLGTKAYARSLVTTIPNRVPYTGADSNVNLGSHYLQVNSLSGRSYSPVIKMREGAFPDYGFDFEIEDSVSGNGRLVLVKPGVKYNVLGFNSTDSSLTASSSVTAGSFVKSGGTNLQYLMADGSVSTLPEILNNTYTPTYSTSSNVSSYTLYNCSYTKIGNSITVTGQVSVTPTTGGNITTFEMSYPIATGTSTASVFNGTGSAIDVGTNTPISTAIEKGTSDNMKFSFKAGTTLEGHIIKFTFTYQYVAP